ncbi:hypothetical protein BDY21DRAFT_419978 [Lineolata rhizophorae]|uniref:Uncharacterized protein n=1 Tax=Lineolata rhizophorae TaxID=578093 RepID=A0A6A6P612_9PEZI|nr:hypothetical protein BDY21DRAFT_419978 [Lineolata rhizophorae]
MDGRPAQPDDDASLVIYFAGQAARKGAQQVGLGPARSVIPSWARGRNGSPVEPAKPDAASGQATRKRRRWADGCGEGSDYVCTWTMYRPRPRRREGRERARSSRCLATLTTRMQGGKDPGGVGLRVRRRGQDGVPGATLLRRQLPPCPVPSSRVARQAPHGSDEARWGASRAGGGCGKALFQFRDRAAPCHRPPPSSRPPAQG